MSQDEPELAPGLRDLLADPSLWAEPDPDGADALLAAIRAEAPAPTEATTEPRPGEPAPPPDRPTAVEPEPAPGFEPQPRPPAEPRLAPGDAPGPQLQPPPSAEGERESAPGAVVPLAPRRRRGLRVLAAAAVVVVLVGAIGLVIALSGGDEGEIREVAIAGTDLAPDASATAAVEELPSGIAIELDVRDLPPSPPGTYYQGWVRGPNGVVTIGTFHMRGGDDVVELWAGVDLDDYPTLTVTIQQEGAGAESSGRVVLTGEIG